MLLNPFLRKKIRGFLFNILLDKDEYVEVDTSRVVVCKDRESVVSDPFGESPIFCLKLALSRLFSKIIFKSSNDFIYLGNLKKIKSAVKMRSECGFWLIKRCDDEPPLKS